MVEVPARLNHILSFDSPEINSAQKFGVWLDRATLIVVFKKCVRVEEGRAIFAMFEADRGEDRASLALLNLAIQWRSNVTPSSKRWLMLLSRENRQKFLSIRENLWWTIDKTSYWQENSLMPILVIVCSQSWILTSQFSKSCDSTHGRPNPSRNGSNVLLAKSDPKTIFIAVALWIK